MHYTVPLFSLLGCWNQHRLPQCTLSEHFACCCWFTCPLCVLLLLSLSRQCWLHADGARWFICLLSKHVQICATCVIIYVKWIHYWINKSIVFPSGQPQTDHNHILMYASKRYSFSSPVQEAWTTATTSTDQPRERRMAQFSMYYHEHP